MNKRNFLLPFVLLVILLPLIIHYQPQDINKYSKSTSAIAPSFFTLPQSSIENQTLLVYEMNIDVRLDNSIKVISSFVLTNNDTEIIEYFEIQIPKNITSVFSYDPIGSLPFTWIVDPVIGNIINITMRYPLLQNNIYVFFISYEIPNVIYHVQEPIEYYSLDFETIYHRKSLVFNLNVKLPMYSQLLEEGIPSPIFPAAEKISVEDNSIRISWTLNDVELGDSDVFLVKYILRSANQVDNPINLLPLYVVLAFLGGIGISVLAFYFLYRYKLKPVESGLVSSLLSDTEQEVIKAINVDGGVSTQRRICDKTGYSKSKVSQILAKLEEKEVLNRERWGRTNKVTISNPSFRTVGQSPQQQIKEEKKQNDF